MRKKILKKSLQLKEKRIELERIFGWPFGEQRKTSTEPAFGLTGILTLIACGVINCK